MTSILLIDDEPLANSRMQRLLADFPDVEIIGVADSLAEARVCLAAHRPDAVFLDVEMPGGTAFSLLPEIDESIKVVFVTAHERHAVEAFAVAALDYLVKPVAPERLAETILRITAARDAALPVTTTTPRGRRDSDAPARLTLRLRNSRQKTVIRIADICWIESLRNYTRVALHSPPRLVVCRRRLGEWLADLPEATFARISRSEVIQLAVVSGTEWKSRSETTVLFGTGVEPLTLGRASSLRLNALLGDGDTGQR